MSGTDHVSGEITALDESYGHQLVAPRSVTQHAEPRWQERTYYLLFADNGMMLNVGRSVWPFEGLRRGFAGITDGRALHAIRAEEPLKDDDPDAPAVADICIEVIDPLKRLRLRIGRKGAPIAADLTWTARFAPVQTAPLRVEQNGEVVTNYMNFFQSGSYDGWIEMDGSRHAVTNRLGFRDRGWGLRKHEGAPRRGLVLSVFCEMPDEAIYLILFETASGRRILTNGWRMTSSGVDTIAGTEHDLEFTDALLSGGEVRATFASGIGRCVQIIPRQRLFLVAVGYSAETRFTDAGRETFDVSNRQGQAALQGQTDHGCDFIVGGVHGYGYTETGLGIHNRYRPE